MVLFDSHIILLYANRGQGRFLIAMELVNENEVVLDEAPTAKNDIRLKTPETRKAEKRTLESNDAMDDAETNEEPLAK